MNEFMMVENKMPRKKSRKEFHKKTVFKGILWLPKEIIGQIFEKLPDKSLMRFRCVSKSWDSMISDPNFTKNTQKLLLLSSRSAIQIMDYEGYEGKTGMIDFFDSEKRKSVKVLGSSNGLLCISVGNSSLFLWNLLTGEKKTLRSYRIETGHDSFGFGYDYSTDDYKLVRFANLRMSSFLVYSMRNNFWKSSQITIPDDALQLSSCKAGVLVKNSLYWYATYVARDFQTYEDSCVICPNNKLRGTQSILIFSFDVVDETHKMFLPPPCVDSTESEGELMDFKGYLCEVHNHKNSFIDLWILKGDVDTKKNWMKLMRITRYDTLPKIGVMEPIYFARNGEVLIVFRQGKQKNKEHGSSIRMTNKLYSYNPTEMSFRRVKLQGKKFWSTEIAYSGRLFWINGNYK